MPKYWVGVKLLENLDTDFYLSLDVVTIPFPVFLQYTNSSIPQNHFLFCLNVAPVKRCSDICLLTSY